MKHTHDGLTLELDTPDMPLPRRVLAGQSAVVRARLTPITAGVVLDLRCERVSNSATRTCRVEGRVVWEVASETGGFQVWEYSLPALAHDEHAELCLVPRALNGKATPLLSPKDAPMVRLSPAPDSALETPRGDIPLGTVVAFAGDRISDELKALGWMLCDGAALSRTTHGELFDRIGTSHGGENRDFRLPDCRGRFIRYRDDGVGNDPDAIKRDSPGQGGQGGDTVGSVQGHSFRRHAHPWTGYYASKKGVLGIGQADFHARVKGTTHRSVTGGNSGKETRPHNMGLHFIIKTQRDAHSAGLVSSRQPAPGELPVVKGDVPIGTLASFAGPASSDLFRSQGWQMCGSNQIRDRTQPEFEALFEVIGNGFGGDGIPDFYLPNFSGLFVRGVDDGAERDPDRDERVALAPGGNEGDRIGSKQNDETGPHTHNWGQSSGVAPAVKDPYTRAAKTVPGTDTEDAVNPTGNAETRPVNLNLEALIKHNHASSSEAQRAPIGSVWMFSGPKIDVVEAWLQDQGWFFCDGRTLNSSEYPELYAVIGEAFKHGDDTFAVPDCRSRFIRALSGDDERDPDRDDRTSPLDSGCVVGNVVGSLQDEDIQRHAHDWFGRVKHALVFSQDQTGLRLDKGIPDEPQINTDTNTGKETRPKNVCVHFIIKAVPFIPRP